MACLYLLWTIVTTWPLALRLGSGVPSDLGDPLLVSWFLWWDSHVVPLTERWWNAPMFFPTRGVMAFSEHFLGTAALVAPIIRLTGNLQLAYNIAFLLTFVLSALSAYALCFIIVRRHDAAFVAGLAFGFAPYRWSQLSHLHVLSVYWMPVALLALHRYFEDRRPAWLALFSGAWVMQALACGYFLFYGSVLIGLWLLWFGVGQARTRDYVRIAAAWGIGALALAPIAYGYRTWQSLYGFSRSVAEIEYYSADVASLLKAPDLLRFWSWLKVFDRPESPLFPGLAIPLVVLAALAVGARHAGFRLIPPSRTARVMLSAAAVFLFAALVPLLFGPTQLRVGGLQLVSLTNIYKPFSIAVLLLTVAAGLHPLLQSAWRQRSPLVFYALAVDAMWLLSLGPSPTIMGRPFLYKAPYTWLMLVPGVDGVRVPARFWMLAALCLAVAGGIAIARLSARWPRLRWAMLAAICLGVAVDGWPARLDVLTPPDARPSHANAVARLDLPVERWHDMAALYRAAEHRRPLLNGYSGYYPPHYQAMQYLLDRFDPQVLTRLSALGPIEIVVGHDRDEAGEWRRFVGAHPQAQTVYAGQAYTSYLLAASRAAPPGDDRGSPLPIQSIAASVNGKSVGRLIDHDPGTRWDTAEAQRGGETLTIDLGRPLEVRGLELQLGSQVTDFPRQLRIETSADGTAWAEAWSGGGALPTVSAGLDAPRTVPLWFGFAPVSARYLRVTQTGTDETYYWSIEELAVRGR